MTPYEHILHAALPESDHRRAGDEVFDALGDLLLAERYAEVDDVLLRLPSDLGHRVVFAVLSITRPWSGHLKERTPFYHRVESIPEEFSDFYKRIL